MAEEKNIKAVVNGKVSSSKERSLFKRIRETFAIGNIREARDYIITDVVIPGFLDLLYDGATRGLGKLIYGDKAGVKRKSKGLGGTDYSTGIRRLSDGEAWKSHTVEDRRRDSIITAIYDYNEVELDSRADAERLLDNIVEYLDSHEIISVADIYSMAGHDSGNYTDNYWGWDTVAGSHINRKGEKWVLVLPRAKLLKEIK